MLIPPNHSSCTYTLKVKILQGKNSLNVLGARKSKVLNSVVKFGYCYLCLKENLRFSIITLWSNRTFFFSQRFLHYLSFKSLHYERTLWMCIRLNVYVFLLSLGRYLCWWLVRVDSNLHVLTLYTLMFHKAKKSRSLKIV
jgi:hypothetical protein